jgi:hypothetical protein
LDDDRKIAQSFIMVILEYLPRSAANQSEESSNE